jgi:pyruvate, orthophosphate dikinase
LCASHEAKGDNQLDRLLQALRIKGRAKPDALEAAIEADATAAIEQCEQDGLVENTKLGYRITDLGRERVDEAYAREREHAQVVIDEVYETFLPINDEVKQIVTDWQMREVDGQLVLNDHQDPAHDANVIARLQDVDAKVSAALASLCEALPRFDCYARRLQRALARIGDGDHTMVAAPIKDSYHTVWFELHEELIVLSGRERTE